MVVEIIVKTEGCPCGCAIIFRIISGYILPGHFRLDTLGVLGTDMLRKLLISNFPYSRWEIPYSNGHIHKFIHTIGMSLWLYDYRSRRFIFRPFSRSWRREYENSFWI